MKYPDGEDLSSTLLKNSFKSYINKLVLLRNNSGFFNALDTYEYYWGSNSSVLNRSLLLILAYDLFGEKEYFDVALEQLNYILGINPHNISFITGVGSNPLMHPHHAQSSADNIDAPVPGLISGGPNQYLNDPLLQSMFNENTPPALCFVDDERTYASNEIAINWNAPLVFVLGYFNGIGNIVGVQKESSNLSPNSIELYPNYPNPFNGFTQLNFFLAKSQKVNTKVYNSIGQKVLEIKNGYLSKGFNRVAINFNNIKSSGVYFYEVSGENNSTIGKLVYLK
jgi:endoglucanase